MHSRQQIHCHESIRALAYNTCTNEQSPPIRLSILETDGNFLELPPSIHGAKGEIAEAPIKASNGPMKPSKCVHQPHRITSNEASPHKEDHSADQLLRRDPAQLPCHTSIHTKTPFWMHMETMNRRTECPYRQCRIGQQPRVQVAAIGIHCHGSDGMTCLDIPCPMDRLPPPPDAHTGHLPTNSIIRHTEASEIITQS